MSEKQDHGVLEVAADLQGSVHRMYSLPQWGMRYTFYSRRWYSWCGLSFDPLPGGSVRPWPYNVTCLECLTAGVPDHIRGCTPPFEPMA